MQNRLIATICRALAMFLLVPFVLTLGLISPALGNEPADPARLWNETQRWQQQAQAWQGRLQDAEAQLQRLQANEADLQDHILALGGNQDTFRVLQQQRAALPTVTTTPGLGEAIAEIRLRQFELTQQQRLETAPAESTLSARNALLTQLQTALNTAAALQRTQSELVATSTRLQQALEEELFWIPSNPALTLDWWLRMPDRIMAQVGPGLNRLHLWPDWRRVSFWQWVTATGLLALMALILWGRQPINRQLDLLKDRVTAFHKTKLLRAHASDSEALHYAAAYPAHDDDENETAPDDTAAAPGDQDETRSDSASDVPSPWSTAGALAMLGVQAAPLSLLLLACGVLLSTVQAAEVMSLGPAFIALAFSLFVLQFLGRLLQDTELTEHHLGWNEPLRLAFLQFVRHFAWALLPTTLILALAQQQTLALSDDTFGVLVLVAAGLAIAFLFRRLLRQIPSVVERAALYWMLSAVLVLLPLGLVVLTALGYYYTSLQLTLRVVATFYILTGWMVAEVTVMRGVALATEALRRRREAEDAAQAALLHAGEDGEVPVIKPNKERQLELDKVNQQSRRLARFLLIVTFGSLLWLAWGDLVSVLGGLNDWLLWDGGAVGEALPVSLLDIFTAILIVILTLFLAANLPGLLEMTVLSKLQLQAGSAYAITTLLNYVITGTGLVLALSSLGVSWDKLQWLVAALSVGLGFGLQEIFANFVSGLIILFERPIRIGDVVTLGNLSGRVREIRIRATTITDFDRKDIIVPNKTFVTGQLINWSLTDTVTRVTIKVGVAYGSDLDRTKQILLDAASQNSRVLADPEPQVLFLSFGASSLDHELRIHVKELKDRNPAIDEINRYIDQAFKAENIEISFQQIDIRLRNSEGLERVIETRDAEKP